MGVAHSSIDLWKALLVLKVEGPTYEGIWKSSQRTLGLLMGYVPIVPHKSSSCVRGRDLIDQLMSPNNKTFPFPPCINHQYRVACIFFLVGECTLDSHVVLLGCVSFPILTCHFKLTCQLVSYELACLFFFFVSYLNSFCSSLSPISPSFFELLPSLFLLCMGHLCFFSSSFLPSLFKTSFSHQGMAHCKHSSSHQVEAPIVALILLGRHGS